MAMFAVYLPLSDDTIIKDAKEVTPRIKKFFEDNPKREFCQAQLWYGKMVEIRRNHIDEDITTAMNNAMKKENT